MKILGFAWKAILIAAAILGVVGCSSPANLASSSNTSGGSTSAGSINTGAATTIYVVQQPSGANPTILKFAATASGNVAPTSSFTSSAWTTPDFNPSIAVH